MLSACAGPQAKIEKGIYYNYKYAFSLSVPKGWHHTSEVPEWLREGVSGWLVVRTPVMFFNNETNGFISITCHETYRSSEGIKDYIEGALKSIKEEALADQYVKDFSSNIYPLSNKPGLSLVSKMEVKYENEFQKLKYEADDYFFIRDGKSNCLLIFSMTSMARTYDENKKVYEEVLQSLKQLN